MNRNALWKDSHCLGSGFSTFKHPASTPTGRDRGFFFSLKFESKLRCIGLGKYLIPSVTSANWEEAEGRKETQKTVNHEPEPCPCLGFKYTSRH